MDIPNYIHDTCVETHEWISRVGFSSFFICRCILTLRVVLSFIVFMAESCVAFTNSLLYLANYRNVRVSCDNVRFFLSEVDRFRERVTRSRGSVAVFTRAYDTVFFPLLSGKMTFGFAETAINIVCSRFVSRTENFEAIYRPISDTALSFVPLWFETLGRNVPTRLKLCRPSILFFVIFARPE